MEKRKTLVLGASEDPGRYSYLAINRLRASGHPVEAIGASEGKVGDVHFGKEKTSFEGVDTVTLYLNPRRQKEYYEYILSLKPRRIIFNPGTENPELESLALKNDIEPVEACTLVLLGTGQY